MELKRNDKRFKRTPAFSRFVFLETRKDSQASAKLLGLFVNTTLAGGCGGAGEVFEHYEGAERECVNLPRSHEKEVGAEELGGGEAKWACGSNRSCVFTMHPETSEVLPRGQCVPKHVPSSKTCIAS